MDASHSNRNAANAGFALFKEEAAAECVSEDALVHLKSYKYSSVDKSPVSHYILRPYVCTLPNDAVLRRRLIAGYFPRPPLRNSRDKSNHLKLIQHVWGRQWNWAASMLPLWLAPNMVTLIGFFFILGNVGLLVLFVPDLVGPVRLAQEALSCPITPRT